MSLETPVNINYSATVVRIKAITELAKCDFMVGTPLFGSQAIVSKDVQVGDLGIYFPAEVQLSHEFVSANSMYRHKENNLDQTQGGYLEDNRRVKAMKFRGHRSDALFLSLESLATFDGNYHLLQEGDVFDKINGVEICRKYVVPGSEEKAARAKGMQKQTRVDNKFLPEHIDTEQYWRNSDKIPAETVVSITQKLHGCFVSKTKVTMWDGSQKMISKIVPGDIVVGERDGKLVQSEVLNAFTTGKTPTWLKSKFQAPSRGDNPTTFSTPDHKFYTARGYVRADQLRADDVITYSKDEPEITADKAQILIGMKLGDGSLTLTKKLSMEWGHKADHREYMDYLRRGLGNLIGRKGDYQVRTSGYGSTILADRTKNLIGLTKLLESWANGVPANFDLTPLSLAVLYMDDGSLGHHHKQEDRAHFAICGWDDVSAENIRQAMIRYGFANPILYKSANKNGKAYNRIRLNKDDAEGLFVEIRNLIPEVMQYKLPSYHRGFYVEQPVVDSYAQQVYNTHLISQETVASADLGYGTKWDIETTTGNFFAARILVHNSSLRVGNTIVARKLSWLEKIAKKFGVKVAETEYSYVFGSRKVIKDANAEQNHFYDTDIWTVAGKKLEGLLPQGYVVYGELVGWTGPGGGPIQSGYTYEIPEGLNELYIYRVAQINPEGRLVDLSWDQVKEFCLSIGQKHVPELATMQHWDINIEEWIDTRYFEDGHKNALPLGKNKLVDEGVCVRMEGLTPYVLKAKSPLFFAHETKLLDQDVVDTESAA